MHADGSVDWAQLDFLIEEQITAGIDGLVPVGTTGESPTLDTEEHLEVIARTVRVAGGRVPVIAGTGANSTAEALHLTRAADRLGADAFLQVAPYYNKPSQEGLFQHFAKVAGCTDKPIVLYSIPGRCGVAIETATVARLAEACPNIRHIKEAGGQVEKVVELRAACPEVTVWSGDDGLIELFVAAGATGVVSVAANLAPRHILTYLAACLRGDATAAAAFLEKNAPLVRELVFLEGNPVTIKEALYQTGKLKDPAVRLPLVRMSVAGRERVANFLQQLDLLA